VSIVNRGDTGLGKIVASVKNNVAKTGEAHAM
jgi:hypothetical protein